MRHWQPVKANRRRHQGYHAGSTFSCDHRLECYLISAIGYRLSWLGIFSCIVYVSDNHKNTNKYSIKQLIVNNIIHYLIKFK